MYVCMYVRVCTVSTVSVRVGVYVCMYVCMYVCVCVYIYIYIYRRTVHVVLCTSFSLLVLKIVERSFSEKTFYFKFFEVLLESTSPAATLKNSSRQ